MNGGVFRTSFSFQLMSVRRRTTRWLHCGEVGRYGAFPAATMRAIVDDGSRLCRTINHLRGKHAEREQANAWIIKFQPSRTEPGGMEPGAWNQGEGIGRETGDTSRMR